jgi:hypothetical protein
LNVPRTRSVSFLVHSLMHRNSHIIDPVWQQPHTGVTRPALQPIEMPPIPRKSTFLRMIMIPVDLTEG